MTEGPLGRLEPTDWRHVEKYPLRALPRSEQPAITPVVIGVNWYSSFDSPAKDSRGRYWLPDASNPGHNFGHVRGGHAVCLKPFPLYDSKAWWYWFNQVSEGICVAEGIARCMSLLNRQRYQPRKTYDWAQDNDEWPGKDYSGTSVRAGLDCARTQGMVPARRGEAHHYQPNAPSTNRPFEPGHGISANRWALSTDEVLEVLAADGRDFVPMLNSWGRFYPHVVYVPAATLERLRQENGEIGLVTDR